jgi:hypothetical protein
MRRLRVSMSILGGTFLGGMLLNAVAAPGGVATQDCDLNNPDPSICGQNSGFVPFHKDAIHASLTWERKKSVCPKMLIMMRPTEYTPSDYLNDTDPSLDPPEFPGFDQEYIDRVQGGFGLGQLDESGWSRYARDRDRENTQLIDVCGLQEQIDQGIFTKTSFEDMDDDYMALTDPFFEDAGYSQGLVYNLFCAGNVAGADGQIYVTGGHDKGGNNGIKKINIFDPELEEWVERTVPCVKSQFEEDPAGGVRHCSESPDGTINTDPLNEDNTDPADCSDSDMEYQRWYPTSVTLPDGKILHLSGTDQDTSVGPANASATKVRIDVPEVYNPRTDTNVSLKNAKKLFNMYPRAFVTQTGPGKDDWKVCVAGGAVVGPLPGPPAPAPLDDPEQCRITTYDPWHYSGAIYCLDVQAALADPDRGVDGENHWEHIGTLKSAHNSGAAVRLVTIHADDTWSDKVYLFGGNDGCNADAVATAEMLAFSSDGSRRWQTIEPLVAAVDQNNAAVLPDGKILLVGGRGDGVNNYRYQMYNQDGSTTLLIKSPVPRHDHSTLHVMPDASAWVMGGNRVNLTDDPPSPQTQAERDLAVPVLEQYKPPYFFKALGRPVIKKKPSQIRYGEKFKVDVSGGDIGSIVLLRTGPTTHNWAWGNQYVSLPFTKKKEGKLEVTAPHLPGLAIAGDYLLFVVSPGGVPSEGKHIFLKRTSH